MKKIDYNKLIRDKIPQKIARSGASFRMKTLKPKEFEIELLRKVEEEASALPKVKTKPELVSEIADVLDVLDEIRKLKKITPAALRSAQKENAKKKGGFKKKLYLYWTEDTGYRTNEKRNVGRKH